MRKIKIQNKNRGITLIETLVSISILMLSVAGPLALSAQGLVFANFAKNQITAFYLAQEEVELIRNIRDANIKSGNANWLAGIDICKDAPDKVCVVDVWSIGADTIWGSSITANGVHLVPCLTLDVSGCLGRDDIVVKYVQNLDKSRLYGHVFNPLITGASAQRCDSNPNVVCIGDTPFRRYLTINSITNNGDLNKEIRVNATVFWTEGSAVRNVTIHENLLKQ